MDNGESNVVGLIVEKCNQTIEINGGSQAYAYTYKFQVTLPPENPEPSFSDNLTASLETDPFDSTKYQLTINYDSTIPTVPLESTPHEHYITYPLNCTVGDQTVDFSDAIVLFIGTNTTPEGVRVRAKGSVPVTKDDTESIKK